MSWYIRFTRYASAHMVYAQEKQNSCGIASMMMVNFKIKKAAMMGGFAAAAAVSSVPLIGKTVGASMAQAALDYAVKSEPYVYAEYTKVTGSPYDGSTFTDCLNHPAVLRNLGCGEWEAHWAGPAGMAKACKDAVDKGAPCIVRVEWPNGDGHFVVVDERHGSNIIVCDPWDGEVRIVKATDGAQVDYDAGAYVWSFSVGGKRYGGTDSPYKKTDKGYFSGWIVRRK
jgi:hypothetical protein